MEHFGCQKVLILHQVANTYGINVLEFNSSQSSESNSNSSSFSGTGVGVAQWIDYPAQAVSAYDNIGNLNSGGMDTWGDDTFFDNGGGFSVKSNSYFSGTQFDYNAYILWQYLLG